MTTAVSRVRASILGLLVFGGVGCYWGHHDDYDDYNAYYSYGYPWGYTGYGTYTVVRRPVRVVDGWTNRAFRYRPYRGYHIRSHHSSPIVYTAIKGADTLVVSLTGSADSTRVEVAAREAGKVNKEQAKSLMGAILKDYKANKKK